MFDGRFKAIVQVLGTQITLHINYLYQSAASQILGVSDNIYTVIAQFVTDTDRRSLAFIVYYYYMIYIII